MWFHGAGDKWESSLGTRFACVLIKFIALIVASN